MASYKLLFKKSVTKDLRRIPKGDIQRILRKIDSLALEPRGPDAKKLSALEFYRVRRGVYRIIYEIKDDELIILVIKVGHRSNAYFEN